MKLLKKLIGTTNWGDKFDLIFLSAAGNDIIGPEIVSKGFVKNKRDFPYLIGRQLITDSFYAMIDQVVQGYRRFLALRNQSLNENTPAHTYSYLTPREGGTHLGPIKFNKGWIKRHLKHQGIVEPAEQYDIVVAMLDAFYLRVSQLESEFARFLVVDTRNLLIKSGAPDPALWFDEIHPNDKGFKKLAQHIRHVATLKGYW